MGSDKEANRGCRSAGFWLEGQFIPARYGKINTDVVMIASVFILLQSHV
jgi:hypothetical protein